MYLRRGHLIPKRNLKKKAHIADLERKVGQLTYEVDWLKKNLQKSSDPTSRKDLVDFDDDKITIKRKLTF